MATSTADTKQALEKLKEDLTCTACNEGYNNPKVLSCCHIFCLKCLESQVDETGEKHTLLCRTCNKVTTIPENDVSGLQEAFHLHHLSAIQSALEKVSSAQEANCDKCHGKPASDFYKNCRELICSTCTQAHEMWKVSWHDIITIEQLTSQAVDLACSPAENIVTSNHRCHNTDMYCDTCNKLICRDCMTQFHSGHHFDMVSDVFPRHKEELQVTLKPIKEHVTLVMKALEAFDAQQTQTEQQHKFIETQVKENIKQLHNTLDAREKELLQQLRQIRQMKLDNLETKKSVIEQAVGPLQRYLRNVQETLQSGSKAEILGMKKYVVKQIAEMTASFEIEELVPPEQNDIKFSRKIFELNQTCKSFGDVHTRRVCPDTCTLTSKNVQYAMTEEEVTTIFLAKDKNESDCTIEFAQIKAELTSSDGCVQIKADVTHVQGNKYRIHCTPLQRGKHSLHVEVEGMPIPDSPLSIIVHQKKRVETTSIGNVKDPWGVAVNDGGEIIVAEYGAHIISIFSSNGMKIRSIGKCGSDPGEFQNPSGVAVNSQGNIIVCDYYASQNIIQMFSSSGQLIKSVGQYGKGLENFNYPYGIAVHPHTNEVFVADTYNHRIKVLREDLSFSNFFGCEGSKQGEFRQPRDVAFDSDGNVYVADNGNRRIQVFTKEGRYLREFGKKGCKEGELNDIYGIAIDDDDRVYISEWDNHRISLFARNGQFLKSYIRFLPHPVRNKMLVAGRPRGITVDKNGMIYTTFPSENCIKVF